MPFALPHLLPSLAAVALWGMLHFAVGAPLQTRVVDQAKGAQNLASTLNQGAFNFGNAVGASMGALMLTHGVGYRDLSFGSAAVCAVAMLCTVLALRMESRSARSFER
jgi:DHA1 family inner membrane transport protein